jgi:peptide/nickel transport system substrate-binding protein
MTARTNALITGQVDVIDTIELKTANLLQKRPGIKVEEVTGTFHYTLPMNTTVAPFDNNDVRLALKYAIDREKILHTVLRGHGILGNDHPIGPFQPFFNSELPQKKFDADRVKYHLKKAGMSKLKVDLHCSDSAFSGSIDTGILYHESAVKAGIDVHVVRAPADGYWTNTWMKVPWSMSYWAGRPTPDWMFTMAYASGADWNDTFWKHDRFNKILVEARSELDNNKRKEMYWELQQICSDEGGALIPMFQNHVWALSDKIGHGQVAANQPMDGQKAIERWWFV